MPKIKTAISFDKENLPPYIFKYNVALVSFFAVWFAVCIPLTVTIGCIYQESFITYAVMVAVFALFFIGIIAFIPFEIKLRNRLIAERTAEIAAEYKDIPFEKAVAILKENNIIIDSGFICNDVFGNRVVPFNEAKLVFDVNVISTKIILTLFIVGTEYEIISWFKLDGALYNFLVKKQIDLSGDLLFKLFDNDKSMFVECLFKNPKHIQNLAQARNIK